MNEFTNKKVLVTGGTGLIGRQVVALLVKDGASIDVVSLDDFKINSTTKYIKTDLREPAICDMLTKNMDYVFHLAGIKASPKITVERPATMSIPTLMVNTNVLEACRINSIKNVLFTSSIGAYAEAEFLKEGNAYCDEPMDLLPGTVKRMAEYQILAYDKEYGLEYRVVRLGNVYGPGDNFDPENGMFISSLMAKVLRGDNPVEIWGDGKQVRDFIYSKDAARGIIHMMLHAQDCMPVNIGSGKGYTVTEVISTLQKIVRFKVRYDKTKPTGVARRVLDVSKAKSLGFDTQYSLEDGLRETWDWFKENPNQYLQRKNYFVGGN